MNWRVICLLLAGALLVYAISSSCAKSAADEECARTGGHVVQTRTSDGKQAWTCLPPVEKVPA